MTAIRHAGLTDRGRVRERNEDRWCADPQLGLYLVADGIGGNAGGELASQLIVEVLPRLIRKRLQAVDLLDEAIVQEQVRRALAELSDRLRDDAKEEFGCAGMGSTVVLVFAHDDHTLIAHMGDSRAYLVRDGRLKQVTTDHAIIQLLLDTGEITAQEAADHPARGQLTRFVGMPGEALPEIQPIEFFRGDRLLLCSDGLTGMLADDEILTILKQERQPDSACQQLVSAASHAGGHDNITALILAISE